MQKIAILFNEDDFMEIRRDRYLQQLIDYMWDGQIKVITGIRRCGKSFLLNTLFRKYLEFLAEKAPDCFPLIVVNCKTPEELQAAIDEYGLHAFAVVSEFKGDVGKLNWLYGDQTTPTCHYINENGILQKRTERIDQDYLEKEFLKIK